MDGEMKLSMTRKASRTHDPQTNTTKKLSRVSAPERGTKTNNGSQSNKMDILGRV